MRTKLFFALLWYCIQLVIVVDVVQCTLETSTMKVNSQYTLLGLGRNTDQNNGLSTRFLRGEASPALADVGERLSFLKRLKPSEYARMIFKYYYIVKIKYWEQKQMTAAAMFMKLHLNMKQPENFFKNPKFSAWAWFVNQKLGDDSNKFIHTTLTGHGYKAEQIVKFSEQHLRLRKTDYVASGLLNEQRGIWVESGKAPEDIFKELDLIGPNFFDRPVGSIWIKFVRDKESDETKATNTIVSMLFNSNTPEDVATICKEGSTLDDEAKSLAKSLREKQIQSWLDSAKSPEELFEELHLIGPNLYEHDLSYQWKSFMNKKYDNDRKKVKEAFVATVMRFNPDGDVAKIWRDGVALNMREQGLQDGLFQKWGAKGISPEKLFKELELDKLQGEDVFTSPLLFNWIYFEYSKNSMSEEEMDSFLKSAYRYSKDVLKHAFKEKKTYNFAAWLGY